MSSFKNTDKYALRFCVNKSKKTSDTELCPLFASVLILVIKAVMVTVILNLSKFAGCRFSLPCHGSQGDGGWNNAMFFSFFLFLHYFMLLFSRSTCSSLTECKLTSSFPACAGTLHNATPQQAKLISSANCQTFEPMMPL